jgi:hypothetical protein
MEYPKLPGQSEREHFIAVSKDVYVKFPRLVTCLLLFNTAILAAAIFFYIEVTAAVSWSGLPALVPPVGDAGWTYLVGALLFAESILAFGLFGFKAAHVLIVVFCFSVDGSPLSC